MGGPGSGRRPGSGKGSKAIRPGTSGMGQKGLSKKANVRDIRLRHGKNALPSEPKGKTLNKTSIKFLRSRAARVSLRGKGRRG